MSARRFQGSALLISVGLALLCLHPLLNWLFPRFSQPISYTFFAASTFFTLGACLWRAWHCAPGLRMHWLLICAALLPWIVANLMEATAELLYHASPTTATIEDFFYFFYGIPLLLVISMPDEDEAVPAFFVLDVLQAAAAGYLTYAVLFGILPFTGIPKRPITLDHLAWVFDVENLILALLASVRLAIGTRSALERRFYQILTAYLWLYAASIAVYNHLVGVYNDAGVLDFFSDVPFVALAIAAVLVAAPAPRQLVSGEKHPLALVLDNVRPIVLGLSLVALSAVVAQRHLWVALGFIFGSFAIYGIRSSLLQNRIQQTRLALEKANSRLEELAMQDGLTGIANRRCFDQRFAAEWSRAHRSERPLSLLIIDVDHFKELNDSQGHIAGDECLQSLASAVRIVLRRPGDLLARYGGDEFVALLPETDAAGAIRVAVMMKDSLAERNWNCHEDPAITVSIGCSCWDPHHSATPETLLEAADKALYHAKQRGRDRIEFIEMRQAALQ